MNCVPRLFLLVCFIFLSPCGSTSPEVENAGAIDKVNTDNQNKAYIILTHDERSQSDDDENSSNTESGKGRLNKMKDIAFVSETRLLVTMRTRGDILTDCAIYTKRTRVEALDTSFHEAPQNMVQQNHLCTECGKTLKSKSGLRRHLKRHLGTGVHYCATCDMRFVEKGELEAHNTSAHEAVPARLCRHCRKSFLYKSNMRRHEKSCQGLRKPNKFVCGECSAIFSRYDILKDHLAAVHNRENRFTCKTCGKTYRWRSSACKHTKRKHCKK